MINEMIDNLELTGWAMQDDLFSEQLIDQLNLNAQNLKNNDLLELAAIGKLLNHQVETTIRNNKVYWIDDWESSIHKKLQIYFQELMTYLNRSFYLSIKRFESQYSYYQPGGFYKKHLDQLKDSRHRQVSCIIYLNDCNMGGELVLYNRDNKNKLDKLIKPKKGRMVIFFSSQIFHEVKTTKQDRFCLTTWFRDDEVAKIYL